MGNVFLEVVMQAVRAIVDSGRLGDIITLPSYFQHKKVEVIVRLATTETMNPTGDNSFSSESFGMWEDREDMNDVESYVRNLRKGRKLC